jgi:hypothetical protein
MQVPSSGLRAVFGQSTGHNPHKPKKELELIAFDDLITFSYSD